MSRYAKHYFNYENALPFFLISFLGLLLVLALILAAARIQYKSDYREEEEV